MKLGRWRDRIVGRARAQNWRHCRKSFIKCMMYLIPTAFSNEILIKKSSIPIRKYETGNQKYRNFISTHLSLPIKYKFYLILFTF